MCENGRPNWERRILQVNRTAYDSGMPKEAQMNVFLLEKEWCMDEWGDSGGDTQPGEVLYGRLQFGFNVVCSGGASEDFKWEDLPNMTGFA